MHYVCPPVQNTPHSIFVSGYVKFGSIDGDNAPVGSVVEARNPKEDTVGCVVLRNAGILPLMRIYGEDTATMPILPGMRDGEIISFYVDGQPATICGGDYGQRQSHPGHYPRRRRMRGNQADMERMSMNCSGIIACCVQKQETLGLLVRGRRQCGFLSHCFHSHYENA